MADENDVQDGPSGEPTEAAALAAETLRDAELLAAEADLLRGGDRPAEIDVLVVTEEALVPPSVGQRADLGPVQLALYAGWTMAVLYGTIPLAPPGRPSQLPTINELAPEQRRELELARLKYLLTGLLPDFADPARVSDVPRGDDDHQQRTRRSKLESLNLAILTALTATRPELQLAYELGRSLRDTANPPAGDADLGTQLERRRIARLQDWLVTLSPEFPPLTAAVVAASIGRWSDVAAVTVDTSESTQERGRLPSPRRPRSRRMQAPTAETMYSYLLQQGDIWLMLLIGELQTSGLLTPQGYVSAGEAALRRSGAIVRGILRHYWFGLLCLVVALGGTLFLAARYLEGGGKVWTSIACIAGALGVSVQTIASTSARLAAEAERPVFAMAEEDAMAWAITTMPPLTLAARSVRHLRQAGVDPDTSLGRF
jgi:hypothetical protein